MENSSILGDHKRVGKKFIPPLMQFLGDSLGETSWIKEGIPELIWIALLNNRYGFERGADLVLSLAKKAKEPDDKGLWFGRISSFGLLNDRQKKKIVKTLIEEEKFSDIFNVIASFNSLYPESPLSFLGTIEMSADERILLLEEIKTVMMPLFDKTSQETTFVQANGLYVAFVTGILQVVEGNSLANFPEVQNYPLTEESKKIAAAIRATMSFFIGEDAEGNHSVWVNYFWNRGLEIDECEVNL